MMALTDDLVVCYELDESSGNAIDAHSNGYDLTDNGTVQATSGKVSGARLFAPANVEYFSRASNADLQAGDIDFTLAGWVKTSGASGSQCVVGKYTTTTGNREYVLMRVTGDSLRFIVTDNGAFSSQNVDTVTLSTGTWRWITCGHNATSNEIWIAVNNGTPSTAAWTTGVYQGSSDFRIGAINGGSAWLFDGAIDQVAMWKRDLRDTPDDMAEIYNSGSGLAYASWAPAPPAATVSGFNSQSSTGFRGV